MRLDDAGLLQDVPTGGFGPIPIPFNPSTAVTSTAPGFRVAVFDGSATAANPHTLDPNDPTFLGFAQPLRDLLAREIDVYVVLENGRCLREAIA